MLAIIHGQDSTIQFLLQYPGIDLTQCFNSTHLFNKKNEQGETVKFIEKEIPIAIDISMIEKLIGKKFSCLGLSCLFNISVDIQKEIIKKWPSNKNIITSEDMIVFCQTKNVFLMKEAFRLEPSFDANVFDYEGNTLVHAACRKGDDELLTLLIKKEARVIMKIEMEKTLFTWFLYLVLQSVLTFYWIDYASK